MNDLKATKSELRARFRAEREDQHTERGEWSRALVAELLRLPLLGSAAGVALFWPMLERGEVDLRELDAVLRQRGQRVSYPYQMGNERGFRWCSDPSRLGTHSHGYRQPGTEERVVHPGELQVIVVPALALTASGARLGYGAGFYDWVLSVFRPPAVAVGTCFDAELVLELPEAEHDQPMDWIVTECRAVPAVR